HVSTLTHGTIARRQSVVADAGHDGRVRTRQDYGTQSPRQAPRRPDGFAECVECRPLWLSLRRQIRRRWPGTLRNRRGPGGRGEADLHLGGAGALLDWRGVPALAAARHL